MTEDDHEYKRKNDIAVTRLEERVGQGFDKLEGLERKINLLITREEFAPVKLIAYGLAVSIFTSVMAALLSKVILK